MSEAEMNSYRLTTMEEPGDERMAQIMREVAEDARESNGAQPRVWLLGLRLPRTRLAQDFHDIQDFASCVVGELYALIFSFVISLRLLPPRRRTHAKQ